MNGWCTIQRRALTRGTWSVCVILLALLGGLSGCGDTEEGSGDITVDDDLNNDDGSTCGDGVCNLDETPESCAQDCGDSVVTECGDGTCEPGEDADNCPQDCSVDPAPECGDGDCNGDEDSSSCPQDCPPQRCEGDDDCGPGEICTDDACVEGCREDSDCAGNELCVDDACGERGEVCREDSQCDDGFICDEANGVCVEDMGQCLADGNEPNDNTAEAADLGEGTFDNLSICPADNDYYRVSLDQGAVLSASIAFDGANGELALQLVNADSQPIAMSSPVDGGRQLTFEATETGDVFLRVAGSSNDNELTNEYSLTIAVDAEDPNCDDDDSEPNDSANAATLLTPSGLADRVACAGDEDFYSFTLAAGDTGIVTANFTNAEGDLTLVLLDTDGVTELSRSAGEGDTETVRVTSPAGGTYVAQVITAKADGGSNYGLSLQIIPDEPNGCIPDAFEPNNSLESPATLMGAGNYTDLVSCSVDEDFYAIEVGPLDELTIDVLFSHADGDIDITLFDPLGVFAGSSAGVSDNEQVSVAETQAGLYVLQVRMFSTDAVSNYSINVGIVEGPEAPPCEDTFEPNNDSDNASAIVDDAVNGAIVCADDPDFYSFTTTSPQTFAAFTATSEIAFGDVDLAILDADGETVLAETTGPQTPVTVGALIAEPGTYFVRATLAGGENTAYDLTLNLTEPPACEDVNEPNDDINNPTTVGTNDLIEDATACNDEQDIYEILIEEPFTLTNFSIFFTDNFGDINAELLDSDGETVLFEANSVGADETFDFFFENTGAYFLRVFLADGINTPYTLATNSEVRVNCEDDFEPNSTPEEATLITPGVYPDLTACDDPNMQDFFTFTLTETGTVSLDIFFAHADGNLALQLRNDNQGVITTSDSFTDDENITRELEAGTYFVRVFYSFPFGDENDYELAFRLLEPADCIDANEPNDEFALATPLDTQEPVPAVACLDDADFYSVVVEEAFTEIRLDARFNSIFGDVDLELLDVDGATVLDTATSTGNNESLDVTVENPGTYFVRAFLKDNEGDNTEYSMALELRGTVSCVDSFEPNNDLANASDVTPGTYPELTLCSGEDTNDFYAIFLEAGDAITVELFFTDADGDIDLRLLDTDGVATLDSSLSFSDNEEVSATVQNTGFHFIRANFFGDRNLYDMVITAPEREAPVCEDDLFEDDDDALSATPLTEDIIDRTACAGDEDWYVINVPEGQVLDATLTFVHADGDLQLELIDLDGETVLLTANASNEQISEESAIFRANVGGDYFLRVRSANRSNNTYSLSATILDEIPVEECRDRFEPNNEPGVATTIEPGEYTELDLCGPTPDDDDWYAIELLAGDQLNVDIFFTHADGDIELRLRGPGIDGPTLDSSTSSNDDESVSALIAEDGTYFIQVDMFSTANNTYSMVVDAAALECEDDQGEEDDTPGTSTLISPGTYAGQYCVGDSDFFQFLADQGDVLDVLLDFPDVDSGDLDLRLYDQDGETVLAESTSTLQGESLRFALEDAGLYFIEVFANTPAVNSYELTLGFIDCEDDFEPNDTFEEAFNAAPGDYNSLLCPGDADFFAVTLAEGETLLAAASFINDEGNINLRLYDTDGVTELDASESTFANSEVIAFTATVAGDYFIEVFSPDAETLNTYDLNFTVDNFCDDEFEPNNSIEEAVTLTPGTYNADVCRPDTDPTDFYAVDVTAGQTLVVTVEFDDDLGDIDVTLFDSNENTVDSSTGTTDIEIVETTAAQDETFFVNVRLFTNNAVNPYTITVEITDP